MDNANPLRILFVEDVPSDAVLAEREIRKSGLESSSQRVDTKDAMLKALQEFHPDIIVSDYSMPEFDGMLALNLAKEYDSRIPFILLTGSVNEETAAACMKAGAWDYVIKEHMTRLPFAVKDALEQKKIRAARNEAEGALRESEERFHTLVTFSPDAIYVHADGLVTLVNPAMCKLLGADRPSQLVGKSAFEIVDPRYHEIVRKRWQSLFAGQPAPPVEEKFIRLDGTAVDVEVSAVAIDLEGRKEVQVVARDITERKRAEEKIALLAHAVKSVIESVSVTDLDDTVLFVNQAFLATYGYDEHELLGKNIKIVQSPNTPANLLREIHAATLAGGWHGELVNRTKDGREFPVSLSTSFVRDDLGQPIALVGVATDITERKRAEEKIKMLSSVVEQSTEGVCIAGLDGNLTFVNEAWCSMHGYRSTKELLGKSLAIFHNQEQMENEVKPFNEKVIELGAYSGEVGHITRDGKPFPTLMTTTLLKDKQGKPYALAGIAKDITERKRVEGALADSEKKFKRLFDYAPIAYHVLTPEGTIKDVNLRWCETLGYSRDEVLGKPVFDFIPESERSTAKALFETKKKRVASIGTRNERSYLAKDGAVKMFLVSDIMTAAGQGGITSVQTTMEDITERKKAEQNLLLSEERFRSVWDNSADGMRLTNREGQIIDVNGAFCRLVRKSREELLGKVLSVAYQSQGPDDDLSLYHKRFDRGETISNLFGSATLWDGDTVDLHVSSSFIETAGQERMLLSLFRDVTEQKKAEKRLQEERNLLRTLIDAIPDEIAVKDVERRFVLINPETMKALKKTSSEEIIGKRDEDLIPERFALEAKKEEEAVLARGQSSINRQGKSRVNAATGEIERSILISKIPLKDSSGKVVGLVGINRDITEVQRASASLEKERTLLLTLIESIPDEICLKDTAHRFVLANKASVRALGARSMQDLLGKTDLDFASPEMTQLHFAEEDAVMESGEPMINSERIRRNPETGEIEKCLLTTKVPVRDHAGKKIGILVVNRYITERKKAEEALRGSEEKFRTLFEESKDVVYFSSIEGRILDINAAGVQLFGYGSKEELLQIDLGRDSYIDPEQRKRFRDEIEKMGFVKDFEISLKQRGGKILTVLETATAVRDNQGRIVQYRGIMRDVTQQKLLEQQFIQAQKMESIGTLAGGIAHDFNNILGIVLGHLALLERTRNNDAQFEESIFSINKAVERGASLVRQILTFARRAETELEPVNINAAIKEFAKMLEETFPKTIAVTLQLDKTIPVVSMDPTQLHQTLLNLCVNARDAMNGRGSLAMSTRLVPGHDVSSSFPKASASHYVRVSVADTGTGMDEETRQRIFEPFFTTKEKGKGTGLGLAVVYGVLQTHNGFVDVETAPGAGTTFHMFFPVPEGILAPTEDRTAIHEDLPRGTETILVVEDEDILRDLVVKLLEMQGYKVIAASDGEEAVRRFKEHAEDIDLVLSDMGLPKRSGWDAFRLMQKIVPSVRALLASGYIEPGQKSEILKSGVMRFIHKPYRMEEVLKAVRETLDEKE